MEEWGREEWGRVQYNLILGTQYITICVYSRSSAVHYFRTNTTIYRGERETSFTTNRFNGLQRFCVILTIWLAV